MTRTATGILAVIPGYGRPEELRQIAGIFRMEFRKFVCQRESLISWLLASLPILFALGQWAMFLAFKNSLFQETMYVWDRTPMTVDTETVVYSRLFKILILNGVVFFMALHIFSTVFKSDIAEKTLHLYFLAPVRRSIIIKLGSSPL